VKMAVGINPRNLDEATQKKVARPARFERATLCLEGRFSIVARVWMELEVHASTLDLASALLSMPTCPSGYSPQKSPQCF
jgi:hypothetical protein